MWTGKHKVVYICSAQGHVSTGRNLEGELWINWTEQSATHLPFPSGCNGGFFCSWSIFEFEFSFSSFFCHTNFVPVLFNFQRISILTDIKREPPPQPLYIISLPHSVGLEGLKCMHWRAVCPLENITKREMEFKKAEMRRGPKPTKYHWLGSQFRINHRMDSHNMLKQVSEFIQWEESWLHNALTIDPYFN